MRLARIEYQGDTYHAAVGCSGYIIEAGPVVVSATVAVGSVLNEEDVRLLPPTEPGKILGIGWNFREHIKEMVDRLAGDQVPESRPEDIPEPLLFLKPPSSLIGHREVIVYPKDATRVEFEGELAVVISRPTRRVSPEEARDAVLGWTCANDVTERDMQGRDRQWWRAKGYDTFAVAGPHLETETPSPDSYIRTRVNGALRQESRVSDMIRDPFEVISIISQAMTLNRGDLIMLGTPPGVGELHSGDEVEVEIDGVGYLRNRVELEEG